MISPYRYRLGIDVGGTFTDLCLFDEVKGQVAYHKVASTPHDPSDGCMTGLRELVDIAGIDPKQIDFVAHGSTVVTNAILQSQFAKLGLITTRGFRDTLEIGNQTRPSNQLYNPQVVKPAPLIRRYLRCEVTERLNAGGDVLLPLDEEEVRASARFLAAEGVDGIVVAFLFSFLNPAHEQRAAELIAEVAPDVKIVLSSEVLPVIREYDRTLTATLNAALAPVTDEYLVRFENGLDHFGVRSDLQIMHSGGGLVSSAEARVRCLRLALSGPAAGIMGMAQLGHMTGHKNLIGLDMGGTSCDMGLIVDGDIRLTTEATINDYPVRFPMADISTIGAGGGSVAWIDSGGALRVGPHSAGAVPGPLAYGKGGTLPTVTDANLVLGKIDPAYFLGGSMPLDMELAEQGIAQSIAEPLGLSVAAAAAGIIEVVNANMLRALKVLSVQRGHDPRDFALVPFGGAGGLHAADIAGELGINTILVPETPGTLSSLGLLVADLRHDFTQTLRLGDDDVAAQMEPILQNLMEKGRQELIRDGLPADSIIMERTAALRYVGQFYHLVVTIPDEPLDDRVIAGLKTDFHALHRRQYGYAASEDAVEVVHIGVAAIGRIPPLNQRQHTVRPSADVNAAIKSQRRVYFSGHGWQDCPIYNRYLLNPGHQFMGPAVVEQRESTTVINPGQAVTLDSWGNLIIELS